MRYKLSAIAAACAATVITLTGCASGGSGSSSSADAVPTTLTVWRMGTSTASQVTWMNGVVNQFHKSFPAYKNTKVNVVWIPWANASTDLTNAMTSGKNAPDITEVGNTETPTEAQLGAFSDLSSDVKSWSAGKDLVPGMVGNDTVNGKIYGVPWFGGVRGIWYRKDQFAKAGITSTPTTWAQLTADASKLQKTFPGTYGIGAPTNFTDGIASFIWGAGGQIATEKNGKWTADLTSPASEAGIKFYVSLYKTDKLSPNKYVGQTELGNSGATSGGANEDFALGKLDLYIDGPWAQNEFPKNATDSKNWASFPIPSENGPNPAPAFAGGSDLAVWATSKYQTADWDLLSLMDSETNATTFANLQQFFPPFTSKLTGGAYSGSPLMSGFAKAATVTQISPLNAKNWSTSDENDLIIPTMIKSLDQGADFASTVAKANSELTSVLNTGQQ